MHVIGQSRAKMVLSVAMYNHYKRLNYVLSSNKLAMDEDDMEDLDERFHSEDIGSGKWLVSFVCIHVYIVCCCCCCFNR